MKYLFGLSLVVVAVCAAVQHCGDESNKVKGCDNQDVEYCGESCCAVLFTADVKKGGAAGKQGEIAVHNLVNEFLKSDSDFSDIKTKNDGYRSLSSKWKHPKGKFDIEFSSDDPDAETEGKDSAQKVTFFLSSQATFKGRDNGQNWMLVSSIVEGALQGSAYHISNKQVEFGCGKKPEMDAEVPEGSMEGSEETDPENDLEFQEYLKKNNMTYEEFLKQGPHEDENDEDSMEGYDEANDDGIPPPPGNDAAHAEL